MFARRLAKPPVSDTAGRGSACSSWACSRRCSSSPCCATSCCLLVLDRCAWPRPRPAPGEPAPLTAAAVPCWAGGHLARLPERAAHGPGGDGRDPAGRACRPRCTASPSCRSATSTSARPSGTAMWRGSSRRSTGSSPTWSPITGDLVDGSRGRAGRPGRAARAGWRPARQLLRHRQPRVLRRAWSRGWPSCERLGIQVLHNEHVVIERGGAELVLAGVHRLQRRPFRRGPPQRPRRPRWRARRPTRP